MDVEIRRRARPRLYATPFGRYRVSVARTVQDHRDAFQLVHVAYVWLGIESVRGPAMRITPQHVLPESTIFIARDEDGHLVGTMTVTLDSPAGLPLDKDYPEEIAALRGAGRRLAEYGSLTVVQRCKHTGVTTLLNIAANWFTREHLRATHVVIGVHPKAAPIYRALFDFSPLGKAQPHAELEAPVQGMVQDLATLEAWFRKHFAGASTAGLPFYHHFFDEVPACIDLPPSADLDTLARWKLPREVFRRVFIEGSDRLRTLDRRTRQQLQRWRSLETTNMPALDGCTEGGA
jgi:hypothetical protein